MSSGITFGNIEPMSVTIATDLSDKAMYLVNLSADNTVAIAADASKPLYVLADDGDGSTESIAGSVARDGRMKVKLGGTVTAGDRLTSDANGKAITTVTNTDNYIGVAVNGGVIDDVILVDIERGLISA